MKQEPELIDIFAMFIVQGICASEPVISNKAIVREAYNLAVCMMQERKNYVGERDE